MITIFSNDFTTFARHQCQYKASFLLYSRNQCKTLGNRHGLGEGAQDTCPSPFLDSLFLVPLWPSTHEAPDYPHTVQVIGSLGTGGARVPTLIISLSLCALLGSQLRSNLVVAILQKLYVCFGNVCDHVCMQDTWCKCLTARRALIGCNRSPCSHNIRL